MYTSIFYSRLTSVLSMKIRHLRTTGGSPGKTKGGGGGAGSFSNFGMTLSMMFPS